MATGDELKNLVKSLTPSEKRFIKLIGKARAGSGSQLLELFDWFNKSSPEEEVPERAAFRPNLPTLSVRLNELVLDCLSLLHKEKDVDSRLRTALSEIALLQERKQWTAAARQLRKTKKLAFETSRYPCVMQCIAAEQVQLRQPAQELPGTALADLQKEETMVLARQQAMSTLRFRHDALLALAQQYPFTRDPEVIEKARQLAGEDVLHEALHSGNYLENALAVNMLGVRDVFLRNPEPAIERYFRLLDTWKAKPEWQADQPDLLITICKYFQSACFYSIVRPDQPHAELMTLKGFDGLAPGKLRSFRETLFHHHFIQSLNTGQLDQALAMIPEIEDWLEKEAANLSEAQQLPFLCNFLVSEFLAEKFIAANKLLQRIFNLPNRKMRVDIREFARVIQPVIHYELGNDDLNEYLTRSGVRHFRKNKTASGFELIVLRNLELLLQAGNKKQEQDVFQRFLSELETLNRTTAGAIPLLGLNEIRIWLTARQNRITLREVFMEEVKKAHALAGSEQ